MEEFLEKMGRKLGDTMEDLGKVAADALDVQKIKGQISSMRRANERDFAEIGRKIFEEYQKGEAVDARLLAYCEEIEEREERVRECEKEISRIKGE